MRLIVNLYKYNQAENFVRLVNSVLTHILLAGIWVYRCAIRPLLPGACRFYPSCSEYARLSLVKYGPFKGGWRAFVRLLKCHPFHSGGVDLP